MPQPGSYDGKYDSAPEPDRRDNTAAVAESAYTKYKTMKDNSTMNPNLVEDARRDYETAMQNFTAARQGKKNK